MSRTTAAEARAGEPKYYVWSFPGCPVSVHFDLKVVERLEERVRSGAVWGLLLGRAVEGRTEIYDWRPLDIRAGARSAIADFIGQHGNQAIAGYVRTHEGESLSLTEDDLALAQAYFPDPHHVILLIRPGQGGPASAAFFFWDRGRMEGDFAFLEFPLDAGLLAAWQRQKAEAARQKPPAEIPPSEPAAPLATAGAAASAGRRMAPVVAWGLAAVALVLATAFVTARWFRERPAAPAPGSVAWTPGSVGLKAVREGGDLQVTWNRESATVASAISGVLFIRDGTVTRNIQLDTLHIRGGSVLYSPSSPEIQMQLTVTGPQQAVTESVIVVLPDSAPPQVRPARVQPPALVATPKPAGAPLAAIIPSAPARAGSRQPPRAIQPEPAEQASAPQGIREEPPAPSPVRSAEREVPPPKVSEATRPLPPPPAVVNAVSPTQLPLRAQEPPPLRRAEQPPSAAPAQRPPAPATPVVVYSPAVVIRQVAPSVPNAYRWMLVKPVLVQVKVSVDDTGSVVKAEAPPQPGVHQMLINAALDAARRWKFQPARRNVTPIPSEMTLQFRFTPPRR